MSCLHIAAPYPMGFVGPLSQWNAFAPAVILLGGAADIANADDFPPLWIKRYRRLIGRIRLISERFARLDVEDVKQARRELIGREAEVNRFLATIDVAIDRVGTLLKPILGRGAYLKRKPSTFRLSPLRTGNGVGTGDSFLEMPPSSVRGQALVGWRSSEKAAGLRLRSQRSASFLRRSPEPAQRQGRTRGACDALGGVGVLCGRSRALHQRDSDDDFQRLKIVDEPSQVEGMFLIVQEVVLTISRSTGSTFAHAMAPRLSDDVRT